MYVLTYISEQIDVLYSHIEASTDINWHGKDPTHKLIINKYLVKPQQICKFEIECDVSGCGK